MGKKKLTNIKSYLAYSVNGFQRMIYSISEVEDGICRFTFPIVNSGKCSWHLYTDFALDVSNIQCNSDQAQLLDVSKSDDATEIIGKLECLIPGEITISCKIETLTQSQIIHILKQEYGNRVAHIDLLLQSERDLQAALQRREGHIEQLLQSERDLLAEKERKAEQIRQLQYELGYQTSMADHTRKAEKELQRQLEEARRVIEELQYKLGYKVSENRLLQKEAE